MTLTDRSLTFLDQEISLRKEQKEYLSDVESPHREFQGKSRELYLKLVSEIEVLEHLKSLVQSETKEYGLTTGPAIWERIAPKPSSKTRKECISQIKYEGDLYRTGDLSPDEFLDNVTIAITDFETSVIEKQEKK